jgi:hypothetical protein
VRRARGLTRLALLALLARPAAADPSDRTLVEVGLGLALPTYAVGVTLHEGSHALMAKLVGAQVDEIHLLPGRDPHIGAFRFGWTYVHRLEGRPSRALFFAAPKITDALLLGGFASLAFTGAWPGSRYGQVALTVFATGLWIDFAKDVVLFSPHNDVSQLFDVLCFHGWREVPARLVYAGAAVALGIVVAHGYERTFAASTATTATPMFLPVLGARF